MISYRFTHLHKINYLEITTSVRANELYLKAL